MIRGTAVALALLLLGSSAAAAAAGAADPVVKVRPSQHLFEGESVHVSGRGFAPHINLVAVQCGGGPDAVSLCDEKTATFTQTRQGGGYDVDMTVEHTVNSNFGDFDCAASAGACVVMVGELAHFSDTAVQAPISFAPPGPPRRGEITVPMSVPANRVASIDATGFATSALVAAGICSADPGSVKDCATQGANYTDNTGALTTAVQGTPTIRTKHARSVDCTMSGACVFAVWDPRAFLATVATGPDVVAPKEPGAFGIDPHDGLHDGDVIDVGGSGWPAGKTIRIFQCNGLSADSACNNRVDAVVRSDSFFSLSYTVHAVSTRVNCLTGQCWVVAIELVHGIPVFADSAITFAPATG